MTALLLAALVYTIPLEMLNGTTEEITVEDDKQDGVVFIRCEEIAQVAPDPKQIKCLARIEGKPGMRLWFYFPAE